jgi:hypothetical protein
MVIIEPIERHRWRVVGLAALHESLFNSVVPTPRTFLKLDKYQGA